MRKNYVAATWNLIQDASPWTEILTWNLPTHEARILPLEHNIHLNGDVHIT